METFGRELLSISLLLHAHYGAKKVLCTGLVECGGVLVQIKKIRHPPQAHKKRTRGPFPAHATRHASAQRVPPISMALNLEVSNKAPALPIDITVDLMDAFEIFSDTYGGSKLGQPSMKALQCIPLTWACLAVKEASKKAKDIRDREASRCYQEVALPGWIKLCHRAIDKSDSALRFPAGWETNLYYTTLGTVYQYLTITRTPEPV